MGDPKKPKKKYSTPIHPWQKDRIDEERELLKEYGMKNKKEIWKIESKLKNFKKQAKKLVSLDSGQSQKEKKQMFEKLQSIGLIKNESDTGEILGLSLKNLLDRRLQTIVYKKGLARSIKQSRQFISHGHIFVDDKKITKPNYIVTIKEESLIKFSPTSNLHDELHPERLEKKKEAKAKKVKKEEEPTEEVLSQDEIKETLEKVEGND